MSDSIAMSNLKWIIDKLENGTSVLYPEGDPIKLQEYKERLEELERYDDWIFFGGVQVV